MEGLNKSLVLRLHEIFYEYADPRIRDLPFMGSPFAISFVYLCYVVIILCVIPKFMENRKPFSFTKLFASVDVLIFFMSGYMLAMASYLWFFHYNWICEVIDRSNTDLSFLVVNGCWQFLMIKFIYTLQSVAYALAKRKGPVATYILVHHAIFPMFIWTTINYYPGGHVVFVGLMNSFSHFFGTLVRLLYVQFPKTFMEKYKWGIYIFFDVIQFIGIFVHSAQVLFQKSCSVPSWIIFVELLGLFTIVFIYYFFVLRGNQKKVKYIKTMQLPTENPKSHTVGGQS